MNPAIAQPVGPHIVRVRPSGITAGAPVAAPPIRRSKNPGDDFFDQSKIVRPKRDDPDEADVVKELRRRILEWQTDDQEFLKNAEREFAFLSGEHWLDENGTDQAQILRAQGRSAFTIDLITPSVEIVVNSIRINKTSINFVPVSEGANAATADIRTGLYRNIERQSRAAVARETAYYMAVSVGRGYYRVHIEDEDGPTFNRRISLRRIDNLNCVAIDPTCVDFSYADAGWSYTFDSISKDQFKGEYGQDPQGNNVELDVIGNLLPDDQQRSFWFPKEKVVVGEYFRRCWKKREVWKLDDGTDCWKEDAPEGARPVKIKTKMDSFLEYRKMTGSQTLEKRIWPGKLIPIVVVIGREVFRGKKAKINSGMVRPAMAPSQINNYMTSRMVDEVGLSPLPHMFAETRHFSVEQKKIVNDINRHPWSIVEWSAVEDNQGRALPPPAWASPSPNTAAVVQAQTVSKDNLMRVLNTFAPQLGALQASQSGAAIGQVKEQGDISHAAFPDNYNRAMLHESCIVNELMDVVYTEKQAITIVQPDETTQSILINQEYQDKKSGKMVTHLFGGDAKYGVIPQTMAAYPTRMAEGVQRILDLIKSMAPPEIVKILDLVIKDLNIPNAQKYAERLRPPGFQDEDDLPNPQELAQHLQLAQQQIDQGHQLIQRLLQKVNEFGEKRTVELLQIASKERIAAAGDRAGILEAQIKAGEQVAHDVLMAQLEHILSSLENAQDVQIAAASDSSAQPSPSPAASPSPAPSPAGPGSPISPSTTGPSGMGLGGSPDQAQPAAGGLQ